MKIQFIAEDDGAVRFDDLAELFKSRFAGTSQWSIEAWITFLAYGGGSKKWFQYCMNPNSSKHFPVFPSNPGTFRRYSRWYPTLQDKVLLPNDFAEYINHIRNAHDMHSIIQGVLIPGGRSLKRDRQSVFFTAVNPMHANQDVEEAQYDLDKPRIAVCNIFGEFTKIQIFWCNLILAQRKGLQFYQTRSHAIALFRTLPAFCIEKVVYMKTGEDVILKSIPIPKVTASRTHAKFATSV